jgi:hypothetical protein
VVVDKVGVINPGTGLCLSTVAARIIDINRCGVMFRRTFLHQLANILVASSSRHVRVRYVSATLAKRFVLRNL